MTVAVLLVLFASLALLVLLADHVAGLTRVDRIAGAVERSTLSVIRQLPGAGTADPAMAELPVVPTCAVVVPARASGYVQVVHVEQLLAVAAARRVHVRVQPRVGEHVVAGAPLAWIWPVSADDVPAPRAESLDEALEAAVRVGFERTLEQDPGLGLHQLAALACKALSSGVNDPYRAVRAIEHLSVLFIELAACPINPLTAFDPATGATVTIPACSFAEHLALGVGLIRRYGGNEPAVIQALLRLLATVLAACADADRWRAIETQVDLLVEAAERDVTEPADLALVYAQADTLRRDLAQRRSGR